MFCSLVFHIQFEFAYLGCILWFGWVWWGFLCAYFWGLCVVGCASYGWVAFDGCSVMICLALLVCVLVLFWVRAVGFAVVFHLFVICLCSCVFVCVSIDGGFVVVTVNSVGCVVLCLLRVLFVFCYVCVDVFGVLLVWICCVVCRYCVFVLLCLLDLVGWVLVLFNWYYFVVWVLVIVCRDGVWVTDGVGIGCIVVCY